MLGWVCEKTRARQRGLVSNWRKWRDPSSSSPRCCALHCSSFARRERLLSTGPTARCHTHLPVHGKPLLVSHPRPLPGQPCLQRGAVLQRRSLVDRHQFFFFLVLRTKKSQATMMQNLPVHVINASAKRESGKKAQLGNIAAAKVRGCVRRERGEGEVVAQVRPCWPIDAPRPRHRSSPPFPVTSSLPHPGRRRHCAHHSGPAGHAENAAGRGRWCVRFFFFC